MDGDGARPASLGVEQRVMQPTQPKFVITDHHLQLHLTHTLNSPHHPTHIATLFLAPELLESHAPHLLLGRSYWLLVQSSGDPTSLTHPDKSSILTSPQRFLVVLDVLLPSHTLYCQPIPPHLTDINAPLSPSVDHFITAICPVLLAQFSSIHDITSFTLQLPSTTNPTVQAQHLALISPFPPSSSSLTPSSDPILPLIFQSLTITSSSLLSSSHYSQPQLYKIHSISPPHPPLTPYRLTPSTLITLLPSLPTPPSPPTPTQWLSTINCQILGYTPILTTLIDSVTQSFTPSPLSSLPPPHSFLLHGLPGVGKSRLMECVVEGSGMSVVRLEVMDLWSETEGEGEERIRKKFDEAREKATTQGGVWMVVDDVDGIGEERDDEDGEMERGLIASLCDQLDVLHFSRPPLPVFVLFTTSRLPSVPPSVLRRVDCQLHIPPLDRRSRLEVLTHYTRGMRMWGEGGELDEKERGEVLLRVNDRLHGYVGADVEKLCREVTIAVVQKGERSKRVTEQDVMREVQRMRPANLSDLEFRLPLDLTESDPFNSLWGMDQVISELKSNVIEPLKASLRGESVTTPSGLLLYGMAGVGKTSLALAVAMATGLPPLLVQSTSLVSAVLGQSEKNLSHLFTKARASSPAVVLMDQIDVIGSARSPLSSSSSPHTERLLSALLQEMDGVTRGRGTKVFVIATSSRPDVLDAALLRVGRLDCHVRVTRGGVKEREEMIRGRMGRMRVVVKGGEKGREELVSRLAEMSEGCSGADLMGMMREAGLLALRRGQGNLDQVDAITAEDLLTAAQSMRPSLKDQVEHFPPGKTFDRE